jgi:hypothetical protein
MKNLQTSIVVEETWVEKQTEKLQSLPTATSARELDVSTQTNFSPLKMSTTIIESVNEKLLLMMTFVMK